MLKRLTVIPRSSLRLDYSIGVHAIWTTYHLGARCYAKTTLSRKKTRNEQMKVIKFEIPNYTSVSDLSNMINVKIEKLMRDLTKMGFANVTHNYILSREYVELILMSYNYKLNEQAPAVTPENVYDELKSPINPANLARRPPIVTIMGHVDHGKTTILDYLRKSSVVSQEHGGITQHIGAFQVETPLSKRKITFLDTPGHAAFLKMRERGANVTDIVILVISVEDSLMPQTLEALKHARKSGNQMIVAITKIDRISNKKQREKAIEKVNVDLMNKEVPIERMGGDVQVVPISARTGENMDLLEESIVTLSDVMDVKAEQDTKAVVEGYVIESEVKKTVGNVSTILVTKGILQKGSIIICGNTYCKVRCMTNDKGQIITKAGPATPVEVTGWKELPGAGDEVIQVKSETIAKKSVAKRLATIQAAKEAENVDKINDQRASEAILKVTMDKQADEEHEQLQDNNQKLGPKKINFIVKADVSGSVEAIVESISSLGNEEVKCNIVSASAGIPNESDMKMARITNSKVLCFNLGSLPHDVINNKDKIEVGQFNVIYKLIEDVTEILTNNLKPMFETKEVAQVEIRDIFNFSAKKKTIKIAGCRVLNGQVMRNSMIKIIRGPEEEVIFDGHIASLKQGKEDISQVKKNSECGITFENNFEDYEPGDKIIVYEKLKITRYL
ncbi:LANO_0G15610g1_1 [Lachancea nothofagi CBS 11611]|uniref:Translation initiation factor IF-2, mitochondrial n=1 Tax=Lachancea nothofagi CBS 11611 TaxID=1266666 RepID=A0A1G4KKG3_9SACH|nr:LANO_0G15610g1_1 [Lachancea nothofagi CBS 11611]